MEITKVRVYRTLRAVAFWFIPTWIWLGFDRWGPLLGGIQILCIIALAAALREIWKK
ncbi:MAG: hypothetical protein G01um101491_264 [Parcubacteria group bacterium Gr01-1014_91]|nr:MAG: hypothetical protein G01um101491_264 [Parcubacteria group bacterium Gr01-1014_91]